MFAIDDYIGAIVVDETINPVVAIYLSSELAGSYEKAEEQALIIKEVMASGVPFSYSGNALAVYIRPENSFLAMMVGDRLETELSTSELLKYTTLWHNFLLQHSKLSKELSM